MDSVFRSRKKRSALHLLWDSERSVRRESVKNTEFVSCLEYKIYLKTYIDWKKNWYLFVKNIKRVFFILYEVLFGKLTLGHWPQLKRFIKSFYFSILKMAKDFIILLHQILLMNLLQSINFILVNLIKFSTENKYFPTHTVLCDCRT